MFGAHIHSQFLIRTMIGLKIIQTCKRSFLLSSIFRAARYGDSTTALSSPTEEIVWTLRQLLKGKLVYFQAGPHFFVVANITFNYSPRQAWSPSGEVFNQGRRFAAGSKTAGYRCISLR